MFLSEESLRTSRDGAAMGSIACVSHLMTFHICSIGELLTTSLEGTNKRFFTSMSTSMALKCTLLSESFRAAICSTLIRSVSSMLLLMSVEREASIESLTTEGVLTDIKSLLLTVYIVDNYLTTNRFCHGCRGRGSHRMNRLNLRDVKKERGSGG